MMTADKEGISLEHDTAMCGNPKVWFPMRVTYSRELKVKADLDRLETENYASMAYKIVNADTENPLRELVPAINNLIFVHSIQERISYLKSKNEVFKQLRYLMEHNADEIHIIKTVSDGQMENFIRVASKTDDSVMYLGDESAMEKEEKHVEYMDGVFRGVKEVTHRMKRCKRVVGELEGIASITIAFAHTVLLKEIK